PHGGWKPGALLRRGYYRKAKPGGPVAAFAENGVRRPIGGWSGARFQQHVDSNPGPCRIIAGENRSASANTRFSAGDFVCGRTGGEFDSAIADVQPQGGDAT